MRAVISANVMSEVSHDVHVEPPLQLLSGDFLSYSTANRDDAAHLDIRTLGCWGLQQQSAFFDVQVFNPNAPTTETFILQMS